MKRTIIYVFGPKRLSAKYFANDEMAQKEGGWLKIGQTSEEDETKDKWDCAMSRVKVEARTGIPEVCQLYDVFEYPYKEGNNDDRLRYILAEDMYNLESSKMNNRELEKYEIKAGREFVYGVSRSQILNAFAKYERDLMLEYYNHDEFDFLMALIQKNNSVEEEPFVANIHNDAPVTADSKAEWCDLLWDNVIEKLGLDVQITNPKGRPYIYFRSPSRPQFNYVLGYSVRYCSTTVTIETYQGEIMKDELNRFIRENDITSRIPNLKMNQGVKNKNKWAWSVSDIFDKPTEELVDWFVDTLLLFYNSFEEIKG